MKRFDNQGKILQPVNLPTNYHNGRFSVLNDSLIYLNSELGATKPISLIDLTGELVHSFGVPYNIDGSEMQKKLNQSRHLFTKEDGKIIAVGVSYPSIEIYSSKGLIISQQVIDDPLIQEDYQIVVEKQSQDNSIAVDLFLDVYYF